LTANKQHIIFLLYDGYAYEDGETKNARDTTAPFQRRHFSRQEVLVPLDGYDFQRSDGMRFQNDAKVQSLDKLSYMEDSLGSALADGQTRFLTTFLTNYIPKYYYNDSLMRTKQIYTAAFDSLYAALPVKERLQAAKQAQSSIERNEVYITNFAAEQERDDHPRRRVEIEWHRKFTLSFACLIFFFIGAPLGAIIRKGGLGMPAVISIFFFLLYWVIDISGIKLSRDGAWDPHFGVWLSSMVLLPIGIFLTYKATSDSSLFNVDKYVDFFKKVFRKKGHKSEVEKL
jgi:lipopolysaccharide export system permease protein